MHECAAAQQLLIGMCHKQPSWHWPYAAEASRQPAKWFLKETIWSKAIPFYLCAHRTYIYKYTQMQTLLQRIRGLSLKFARLVKFPWKNNTWLTLARLVDFPTPFTPTKTTTYGFPCSLATCTSLSMSIERRGVRIRTRASSISACSHCFKPWC